MDLSDRCLKLNNNSDRLGDCVVYCMSKDLRVEDNFALNLAMQEANRKKVPLIVLFFFYIRDLIIDLIGTTFGY